MLGFDILKHNATTEYTEVTLKVYYGKIGPSQPCRDRKKLGIQLTGITANLSPDAPAFLIHIKKSLHEGMIFGLFLDRFQSTFGTAAKPSPHVNGLKDTVIKHVKILILQSRSAHF